MNQEEKIPKRIKEKLAMTEKGTVVWEDAHELNDHVLNQPDKLLKDGSIKVDGETVKPDPTVVKEMQDIRELQEKFAQTNYMSTRIIDRFKKENVDFFSNHNISEHITEDELELIEAEVAANVDTLLRSLLIDVDNDHNAFGTASRVAKMFINEVFRGRYFPEPTVTAFPNVAYDGAYYTGPISIRSTCAHHFQNITGNCWVGVKPHKEVIGLSKFNRIVDHIASRPQIQEEMTTQIADRLSDLTDSENIAIMVKAKHHCLTHRGVKEHESDMTTTILRGTFQWDANTRSEFFATVNNMKGHD